MIEHHDPDRGLAKLGDGGAHRGRVGDAVAIDVEVEGLRRPRSGLDVGETDAVPRERFESRLQGAGTVPLKLDQ